ncbi:MAG: DUF1353 domain-containing protein [Phyllobacteriaceae bacterium]|nr:DUF1353 domain-containing protein [Phyllobacteriaceae bacterium]
MRGIFVAILLLYSYAASAQTFYGRFEKESGDFTAQLNITRQKNGNKNSVQFNEEIVFFDSNNFLWKTPRNQLSDGASIPQYAKSLVGGSLDGPYVIPAYLHDYYCCMRIRNDSDTHWMFYESMMAMENIKSWHGYIMYLAVKLLGPKWTVTKKIADFNKNIDYNNLPICQYKYIDGTLVGNNHFEFNDLKISTEAYQIAIRKLSAMISIIYSTNGEKIDYTDAGWIAASDETLKARADEIVGALAYFDRSESTGKIGIIDLRSNEAVVENIRDMGTQAVYTSSYDSNIEEKLQASQINIENLIATSSFEKISIKDNGILAENPIAPPNEKFQIEWTSDNIGEIAKDNPRLFQEIYERSIQSPNASDKGSVELKFDEIEALWKKNPAWTDQRAVEGIQ